MKTIEVNGRTVDEALETALKELKVIKNSTSLMIFPLKWKKETFSESWVEMVLGSLLS